MVSSKRDIVLVAHNLRSCHNVGSLFRTAEGLGIKKLYLTGYTPYPQRQKEDRLPHIAAKITKQIDKTALGTVLDLPWQHAEDVSRVISSLKRRAYTVAALEQTSDALDITSWHAPTKIVLIVGRETFGIEAEVLQMCDIAVQIPMLGRKESFNVVQAAAMALFHCRFS